MTLNDKKIVGLIGKLNHMLFTKIIGTRYQAHRDGLKYKLTFKIVDRNPSVIKSGMTYSTFSELLKTLIKNNKHLVGHMDKKTLITKYPKQNTEEEEKENPHEEGHEEEKDNPSYSKTDLERQVKYLNESLGIEGKNRVKLGDGKIYKFDPIIIDSAYGGVQLSYYSRKGSTGEADISHRLNKTELGNGLYLLNKFLNEAYPKLYKEYGARIKTPGKKKIR